MTAYEKACALTEWLSLGRSATVTTVCSGASQILRLLWAFVNQASDC